MKKSEFKKLQQNWYQKAKKSGFRDIEHDEFNLKYYEGIDERFGGPWENKQEYYRLATHFLNDYSFSSKLEAAIWNYHAEGLSCRSIAKILEKLRSKKAKQLANRMTVWRIVSRLEEEMKKLYGIIK